MYILHIFRLFYQNWWVTEWTHGWHERLKNRPSVCCTQGLSKETGRDLIIRSVLPGEGKRLALWTHWDTPSFKVLYDCPGWTSVGWRGRQCMPGLLAYLEAQHLSPNGDQFCFAMLLICCVVFDLWQMLNLLCPRQHFKQNLTHGQCSEPSLMPVWLGSTTKGNKYKALYYYQFIIILSHSAAVPQQGTS